MMDRFLATSGLKAEDQQAFQACLRPQQLKRGAPFLGPGERCRYLAFVETGILRTFPVTGDGKELTTDVGVLGTFCSSCYGFYRQQPSFEAIEAVTDCRLARATYDAVKRYAAKNKTIYLPSHDPEAARRLAQNHWLQPKGAGG